MKVEPEMFDTFCEEECPYKDNKETGYGWLQREEPCCNCPVDVFHAYVDEQQER